MKKNVGTVDRGVRIAAGLFIVILYLAGQLGGTPAVILGIIATALILTSTLGVCPLYSVVKISTRRKE